ncbi:MGDG synthase family glycosyltransferase [Lyngbya confervoides]|uniref:UDP-N-acetylglucosamine:LPS N-acetylglucosamine transferase n=1 Tax=Lyngbya confervoides BDU141951 TaxID=1574623 RepID=A0ABD4SZ80_9CYAN|nr:glycosyltransferase [Lyngbya confervoides]MCM1981699.1 hypothetical protein [Lyngbya confervoides BDU141951]
MVRVLILYASLGSGHVSAAKALEEAFLQFPQVEVQCEDALSHANALYRGLVTRTYEQLSENIPLLYKAFYEGSDIEDLERSLENNLAWATLEKPFFRQLGKMVSDANPDIIVSVQQIPSRLLQLLDPDEAISPPQYVVVTDAMVHSTWINRGVNGYFLPNEISKRTLVQRGIEPDLLHVSGIPINPEISKSKDRDQVRSQLGWSRDCPVVMLLGGGLNVKRVRSVVKDLLESDRESRLLVAAGRNEELLEALEDLDSSDTTRLEKYGMLANIDDYVVASDLIITKAGGLITSEILARGTPMVIIDPIPGQEEENADVIAAAGAGVQLHLPEMVAPAVRFLLAHPERLQQMRDWSLALGRPHAAQSIAQTILSSPSKADPGQAADSQAADSQAADSMATAS